ncbi:MAG: hypothetical protein QOJ02_3587 [Acidobacteriota bacterium]|jgi:hypothetical protein|nr:hypothetical protein [Acidobacteriota bacterium]
MMKRTLLKLLIILPIICIALPLDSFAQSQSSTQAARKFDEFGDIYLTDIKARLDNFAIQLQNEPGTRAFIIVYRSRRDLPGLSSRLAKRMRDYLVDIRGFSAERVVTVDGGIASSLVQELWIVPVGATPTPRSDAHSNQFIDTDSAWKFDEYYYPLPGKYDEGDEYAGSSLEAFADALLKYPRALAYILAYPQYSVERRPEPPGTALKMLAAVKAQLVGKYHIAPARIKFMNGGYRKQRQIELWIVPRGEHPPIPTPNAFPKKRR